MSAIVGKRIAIVGGGPGGLTLARLLQQSGAQVSVYERDQSRSARVQGSALDLHENSGLAALETAGLIDAFWANHRPDLNRLRLTDAKGTVLHDHSRLMSGAGKRPEIERGPLRDLLLDSLQPNTVQWDCKLEAAELQGGGASGPCCVLRADRLHWPISRSAATGRPPACVSWSLRFGQSTSGCRS